MRILDDTIVRRHVLVLGAYGFIGSAVVRTLRGNGHCVRGMVRNVRTSARVLPGIDVVQGDMRSFTRPQDWAEALEGIDVVVNCAGALQDGPEDDLEAVHHLSIAAMGQACTDRGIAVVQVSAIGAVPDADTAFMRTKAAGDAALSKCGASLWVLKPGLVIGQSDYGGTAMLRMIAAVPLFQPLAFADSPIQSVGMTDICNVISAAVSKNLPQGSYDLVEDNAHSLAEVVAQTRTWLGFTPARIWFSMPAWTVRLIAAAADFLGKLGWRSPLRSTSLKVMKKGILGDPGPYRSVAGHGLSALPEIYAGFACGREYRLAARMSLFMPFVVGVLSLFWVLSGVVGLISLSAAKEVLTASGWPAAAAAASVAFWSLVDVVLGLAILWRPWAARVCLFQAMVAGFYLIAATCIVPELWADPLGPLVKVLPAMVLSLLARQMLESR